MPGKYIRAKRTIRKKRANPKTFLIVCEGEQTEPNYFKSFPLQTNTIYGKTAVIEVEGIGESCVQLVNKVSNLISSKYNNRYFSQIWVVFDKDDFGNDQFATAIKKAKEKGYYIAVSNESFELWYVLHFEKVTTAITRKNYISRLNKHLSKNFQSKYKKNSMDFYNILTQYGNQERAIRFAKIKDDEYIELNTYYPLRNPWTRVYKLVEELNKYMKTEE